MVLALNGSHIHQSNEKTSCRISCQSLPASARMDVGRGAVRGHNQAPAKALMNRFMTALNFPRSVDMLVVGAGPAGSAAARVLAQAGRRVLLVDAQPLGRDKVCGDGLIPDAHHALRKLGLFDAVMAKAERVSHVGCVGPSGGRIDVPGSMAVLPRQQLDEILAQGALQAGAQFLQARFESWKKRGEWSRPG
jgi:FAD binding domain